MKREIQIGTWKLLVPTDGINVSSEICTRLWPSSLIMGLFLSESNVSGKTVVDIGAGIGLTSVAALLSGAQFVWLQDLPDHCISERLWETQKSMLLLNGFKESQFDRMPIIWGDVPDENFPAVDIIISSDSFYERKNFGPLFATVAWFFEKKGTQSFVVAYHESNIEYYVGDLLSLWDLKASLIPYKFGSDTVNCKEYFSGQDWPESFENTIFLIEIVPKSKNFVYC